MLFLKATELAYTNCEDAAENGLKIRVFAEAAVDMNGSFRIGEIILEKGRIFITETAAIMIITHTKSISR